MSLFPGRSRPLLLGHRGVREGVRENTLEAFRRAMEAGLDGVELDVQRSADGALVVYHDFWVPKGLLHRFTLAELREMLPGLPTLEEVLRLFEAYPEAILNVELKSVPGFYDGRAEALARLLAGWPGRDRVLVSSFDPVALFVFREEAPGIPLGYLFLGRDTARLGTALGVEALHPRLDLVTPEKVRAWREAGYFVVVWPAATMEEARRAVRSGADAVIGGWPEVLLKAKEELGHA